MNRGRAGSARGATGAAGGVGGAASRGIVSSSRTEKSSPGHDRSVVTFTATRWPPRESATATLRPDGVSCTSRENCRTLRTRSPSNSVMASPALMPALSAGPPGSTVSIRTPAFGFASLVSASSISCTVTPMRAPGDIQRADDRVPRLSVTLRGQQSAARISAADALTESFIRASE